MPLPIGTWTINADGNQGTLVIGTLSAADGSGNVFFQGSATLTTPRQATDQITGFWDEAGQEISFLALPTGSPYPYPAFADYRGKLYSFPQQLVGSNYVTTYTLAGVEALYSMTDNAASWNTLISGRPASGARSCKSQLPRQARRARIRRRTRKRTRKKIERTRNRRIIRLLLGSIPAQSNEPDLSGGPTRAAGQRARTADCDRTLIHCA